MCTGNYQQKARIWTFEAGAKHIFFKKVLKLQFNLVDSGFK